MKNLLQNFYFFSKLSLSFSLLIILILFGYLFYRSYSSITLKENEEFKNNKNLLTSIDLNSSRIKKIELLLNENNSKLNEIRDSFAKNTQNNKSNLILKEIQNDFKNIKSDLKKLQNDLQQNEILKVQSDQKNLNKINIENTAQLIKFKFENGQDYLIELELLNKTLGPQYFHITKKLYLINNNRFIGSEFLLSNFKKETDFYISTNLLKKNKILSTILPYINIQPSKAKKLSDNRLIVKC